MSVAPVSPVTVRICVLSSEIKSENAFGSAAVSVTLVRRLDGTILGAVVSMVNALESADSLPAASVSRTM